MSKELNEKMNDLITRADETLNKAKTEKRELTDDEAQELAEIRDDVRRIKKTLELDDDFREFEAMKRKTEKEGDEEMVKEDEMRSVEQAEEQAFENYVRGRVIHERAGELTPAANGAIIPTTIARRIIKKVYDICPILERSSKYNVKGKLDLPYYDTDTTNITVAYQTEFVEMDSSNGSFTSISLTGFLAGALSKISRSLINNVEFNLVGFIVDEMAYAIKRFVEGELLNGTVGKVTGLSTLTNTMTAASATEITADEVIQLKDRVKDEFQGNGIFIMSPATRTALRLLKDDVGRYLLQDDITAPFGNSLLGKPVYVSDNMPEMAAGNTAIYYGDMRGLATKFSEDINIEVLRERYAAEHAIGVIGWFEFDSKVENAQMIAALKMAAGA